jgi:hypothetical protein
VRRAATLRGALGNGRGHCHAGAPALRDELRPLLSFEIGPGAVEEIAANLVAWFMLDDAERGRARSALAKEAARRYSWENAAKGVIAAAQGRLDRYPFQRFEILKIQDQAIARENSSVKSAKRKVMARSSNRA